jgi:hypothetical protein
MRVLELGNYLVPAYAGMLLAEQGAAVVKWHQGNDPILGLTHGADLWDWINYRKSLRQKHVQNIHNLEPHDWPDVVIDNFRPSALDAWGIDPAQLSRRMRCIWVSMRSEVGEISFDLVAQCRSWMEYAPHLPFYVGDTTGGLWLAFKAITMHAFRRPGHHVLGQATCMQKLVEGELAITPERDGVSLPWDKDEYRFDPETREAVIAYKGQTYREPVRDRAWKERHLWHDEGRMRI